MNAQALYVLFSLVLTTLLIVGVMITSVILAITAFNQWVNSMRVPVKRRVKNPGVDDREHLPLLKDYKERGYK